MLLPEGLIATPLTPFKENYDLDEGKLRIRLESMTEGVSGLCGPMMYSEFPNLTFDEWKRWQDILVDVAKKAKVYSWSFLGAECFEKSIPYGEYALKTGATGFVVLAPYLNKYSQEAAYQYFRDIAHAFPDTPIIFYPAAQTGNHFEASTIAKLAQIPNIVGMKLHIHFTIGQVGDIIQQIEGINNFRLVSGDTAGLYILHSLGIKAAFSPDSDLMHAWSVAFWEACQKGDMEDARRLHNLINKVSRSLLSPTGWFYHRIANVKAAMELMGKPVGMARRPSIPPTAEHIEQMRKTFMEVGLLKP